MKKLYFIFLWLIPCYLIGVEQIAKMWAISEHAQPGDRITCRMVHDPQDDPDFIIANCSALIGNEILTRVFGNDITGQNWVDFGVEPVDEEEYVFLEERQFDVTNDDFE